MRMEFSDLPPNIKKQVLQKMSADDKRALGIEVEPVAVDEGEVPKKVKSKYHAKKTEVMLEDGTTKIFDSKKEAKRYEELLLMEKAGEISNIRLQVPYELLPAQKKKNGKKERAVRYIADFVYEKDGHEVVEDAKGMKRGQAYQLFVIKRKMMLWFYGIEVSEI